MSIIVASLSLVIALLISLITLLCGHNTYCRTLEGMTVPNAWMISSSINPMVLRKKCITNSLYLC